MYERILRSSMVYPLQTFICQGQPCLGPRSNGVCGLSHMISMCVMSSAVRPCSDHRNIRWSAGHWISGLIPTTCIEYPYRASYCMGVGSSEQDSRYASRMKYLSKKFDGVGGVSKASFPSANCSR